ncbi:hypothetical protein GPALN_004902 [Globodera pallida]|nr:hypothetical protein GPALN_004902 [Globodera pallida]
MSASSIDGVLLLVVVVLLHKLALLGQKLESDRADLDTLKFVHALWRHGDRTPTKMIPSDQTNTLDKWTATFGGLDANVVEGRDSGNFSDQDQQDSVGNAGSGKLLSNVVGVGNFGGMSLVEELELAEQHQKMKEELDRAQLEQHQQQNIVEELELAVQHQQQNNNNSYTPHGAPSRHFLLSLVILLLFFVLIVLVVPRVQRGQLVIRISVFFPSAMKLTENVLQSKDVGMEQQHLQQQLVAALNERVEQLELELKETNTKFEQQLEQ